MNIEKNTRAERIVKDLSFIMNMKEEQIIPQAIFKYKLEQGEGQQIKNIKLPCLIYFSFIRYDYEGRYHHHLLNVSIKHPEQKQLVIPKGVYQGLMTMKLKQKSWFNVTKQQLHETNGLNHGGCHFQVVVNDIKYKNSDSIESKRFVNERNRVQGKQMFQKKQYEEAAKRYRNIINITEGLQKGKFTVVQQKQLQQMNLKAKQNFIKCLIKLSSNNKTEHPLLALADSYSKQLLEKRKQSSLSLYLRAKMLEVQKYLDDSLIYAEKWAASSQCQDSKKMVDDLRKRINKK